MGQARSKALAVRFDFSQPCKERNPGAPAVWILTREIKTIRLLAVNIEQFVSTPPDNVGVFPTKALSDRSNISSLGILRAAEGGDRTISLRHDQASMVDSNQQGE